MKKTIKLSMSLLLIAALSLFSTSCKKSVDTPAPPASSQWTFMGATYNPASTTAIMGNGMLSLDATGSTQPAILLVLGTSTPSAGTYTVVDQTGPAPKLAASQCAIIVKTIAGTRYSSVGVAGNTVAVKITGNKITASFSNITVVSIANNQVTDTQNVSGGLISAMQ